MTLQELIKQVQALTADETLPSFSATPHTEEEFEFPDWLIAKIAADYVRDTKA